MDKTGRGQSETDYLASYRARKFPPFAVTVDIALLTLRQGRFSVLLVRRAEPPFKGRWALPGGFVGEDEDLQEAAWRKLGQETNVPSLPEGSHLEQLKTFGNPRRDPRMRVVSVAYVAFGPDLPAPRAGSGADLARYWLVRDALKTNGTALAFDHRMILADAVERARAKLEYTTLAGAFLEEPFTLSDLRAVYQEVWGLPMDASNFRRKILRLEGFVTPVGELSPSGSLGGRPADLYRLGQATQLWPPLRRVDHQDTVRKRVR